MLSMGTLTFGFCDKIVYQKIGQEQIKSPEGIWMLDLRSPIRSSFLYVADTETALGYLHTPGAHPALTLFVSANAWSDQDVPDIPALNLIVVDEPVSRIYNQVNEILLRYHTMRTTLQGIVFGDNGISRLLQTAATLTEFYGFFYVLSPSFEVVATASGGGVSAWFASRLSPGTYLTEDQITRCLQASSAPVKVTFAPDEEPVLCRMFPLVTDRMLGYLVVIGSPPSCAFPELLDILVRECTKHFSADGDLVDRGYREISKIMEDIFLLLPNDVKKLRERLDQLPHKTEKYVRSILIGTARDNIPLAQLLKKLGAIFPSGNIAPYDGHVVILVSGASQLFIPEFDAEALEELLTQYDGYAIIGNAARFLVGMRTLYIQCKEMLPIAPFLEQPSRCIYFTDIFDYYIIFLCATALPNHYSHDKLVYLVHPAIMEVVRYDKKHGTDMQEFLFAYITNECGINQTAEQLHMHRNTVIYKLNKLREKIGLDLRDLNLRHKLISACKIMKYARNVLHMEFAIEHSKTEPAASNPPMRQSKKQQ